MSYDADATRAYFDALGEREWDRLEKSLQGRVKHAVHRRLLERCITPGMRVLDVGSGPGRFAIDLARLGARVTLVDLSSVQLDLARARLSEHGVIESIDGFLQLDVLDLTSLAESSFDAVVCFGGAVSYTMHRYGEALRQLARIARPGAPVLVSVMSLYGALHLIGPLDAAGVLETAEQHLDWAAVLAGDEIVFTVPSSREFHHPLALFTSRGLRGAMIEAGLDVEVIATSNAVLPEYLAVPRISQSEHASATLMALELALFDKPGLADTGGHLLGVARKPLVVSHVLAEGSTR